MEKTAVEWLIEKHFGGINNCTPDFRFHIKQALEMEKQQIKDCFVDVSKANCETFKIPFTSKDEKDFTVIAEQYYQETYKSK